MRSCVRQWAVVFLLALVVTGCGAGKKGPETKAAEKPPRNVEVVVGRTGRIEEKVRLTGHLDPVHKAEINSRLTGQIAQVLVREGDRVRAGQPVILLQDTDVRDRMQQAAMAVETARARLTQAQAGHGLTGVQVEVEVRRVAQGVTQAVANANKADAELADARKDYERQKGLYKEGAVPQIRVDQAQLRYNIAVRNMEAARSQVKAARESLELARANIRQTEVSGADAAAARAAVQQALAALKTAQTDLADTVLRSPITGVVITRAIEPGQTTSAMAGKPLLIVVDNSMLELSAPLDERHARHVRRGAVVQLETKVLDRPVHGTVLEVIPASDPSTHTVRVRIRVTNPSQRLMGGAFATVTLVTGVHHGVLVPRDAIQRQQSEVFVFVKDGDVARRRDVVVPYESPEQSVVTRGIQGGDSVITVGASGLEDGQKVQVGKPVVPASGAPSSASPALTPVSGPASPSPGAAAGEGSSR